MKTITFFCGLITFLPALIRSTPLKRQYAGEFTMIATHSGDPRVHLQGIEANSNFFWIGKPTLSSCPDPPVTNCPSGLFTVLVAPPDISLGISTSHATTEQQMVYVRGATDNLPGSLAFNAAGSPIPDDAILDGFSWDQMDLIFLAGLWWACPAYGAYYVTTCLSSPNADCIEIQIYTSTYNGPSPAAWQYD